MAVYDNSVRCCLARGDIPAAMNCLERSRSKNLSELIGTYLTIRDDEIADNDLKTRYRSLRSQLIRSGLNPVISTAGFSISSPLVITQDSTALSMAFQAVSEEIAARFPNTQFGRKWKSFGAGADIRMIGHDEVLPNDRSAVLDFFTGNKDGRLRAFLVTRRGREELLTYLPGSERALVDLAEEWQPIYSSMSALDQSNVVWKACNKIYDLIFASTIEVKGADGRMRSSVGSMLEHLDQVLEQGSPEDPRNLTLIPHRYLFQLPLHAACRVSNVSRAQDAGQPWGVNSPHYLLEDYKIVYAPSLFLIRAC